MMCYSNTVKFYEIIGWIGTVLVLASYILLSTGVIEASLPYHAMVGIGSIGVALISYKKRVWQPFIINAVFFTFALIAVLRIIL